MVSGQFSYAEITADYKARCKILSDLRKYDFSTLNSHGYASLYRFGQEACDYVRLNGSVAKMPAFPVASDFLWFDIDSDSSLEMAQATAILLIERIESIDASIRKHIRVYFSGAKGFHIGIPSALFGLEPRTDLPDLHKRLARHIANELSIDESIYHRTRLLRIPNTQNDKSGQYKTPLTVEQLKTLDISAVMALSNSPNGTPYLDILNQQEVINPVPALVEMVHLVSAPPKTSLSSDRHTRDVPSQHAWIVPALDGLGKGNRHTTFAKIIGRLTKAGLQPNEILSLLSPHAARVDFVEELQSLVDDLSKRYDNSSFIEDDKGAKTKYEIVTNSLSEFLSTTTKDIQWLVDQLVPRQTAVIVAGPPGCGKSLLMITLSLDLARGSAFLGQFPTKVCRVLYIDEESAPSLLATRFDSMLIGKTILNSPDNLWLAVGQSIRLDDRQAVEQLEAILAKHRPDVVIIDSLIRLHRCEENSAKEMSAVFAVIKRLMKEYDVTFIIVDHMRKNNASNSGATLRGSSDKWAFVDGLISVSKDGNDITLLHTKNRYGEPLKPIQLRINGSSQTAMTLDFVRFNDEDHESSPLSQAKSYLLDLIGEEYISRKDILSSISEVGIKAPLVDKALTLLVTHGDIERQTRKSGGRGAPHYEYRRKVSSEENTVESPDATENES